MKSKGNVVRRRLIAAVSRYARGTRGQVSIKQFCKATGIGEGRVHEVFPGGMRELLVAAGMRHRAVRKEILTFGDLMRELDETARVVGRVPTPEDVDRVGRVTSRTCYDRLGSWEKVREAYARWLKERGRENIATAPHSHIATLKGKAREVGRWHGKRRRQSAQEMALAGVVGRPLFLPGMLYAPTSEAGVVYLFGLMARELGYVVEQIGTTFPDCLALKALEGKAERWRRLRVEFELKSSNFRVHGHDVAGCDVIVCWENDWKDCPVEVVELKAKVEELRRAA